MKKIAYLFLFPAFAASVWTGCKKDADEVVVPPVENLKAYAGKYRAKLEFTAPKEVKSAKVLYGEGKSKALSLTGAGTQSFIVEELQESEQTLNVVTLNEDGKESLPKEVKVKVYGNSYQNSLDPRTLTRQNAISSTSVEFLFEAAAETETGLWIVFVNTSGSNDSVQVANSQTSVTVDNINPNEPYYYYSVFLPEADAIDGFPSIRANAVPPVSNLRAYAGKYRAKLEFTAPAEAQSVKVYYSADQFLNLSLADVATQEFIVENLQEGAQTLSVVTLHEDGKESIPKRVDVNVYGDSYQSSLHPRTLTQHTALSATSMQLTFGAAAENETGLWIVFVNTSGSNDSVQVANSQTPITVNNLHANAPYYYYYSVFLPEADAIDEFYSAQMAVRNEIMFDFEKGNWTIADYSSDGGHWGHVPNSIDDDVTTFWHSDVTTVQAPMPHWIIVDMQSEKKIDGFYFVQTQEMGETGLAKGFRFEISSDNSSWTNVREGEFTTSRARQEFAFAQPVTARYFRITILSGYANAWYSQFAEIDLYNEVNASGANGTIAIPLVNAVRPFQGENPLGGWDGRFQQLVGWTHNEAAYTSYATDGETTMIMFGGNGGNITNGKVYQTVTLSTGNYTLTFLGNRMDYDTGVTAYGVVTTASSLPDIAAVSTAPGVLGYAELSALPITKQQVSFTLSATTVVTIGWVYSTFDTSHGWASLYMDGIELYKNQ
jgi:hypothetical protein